MDYSEWGQMPCLVQWPGVIGWSLTFLSARRRAHTCGADRAALVSTLHTYRGGQVRQKGLRLRIFTVFHCRGICSSFSEVILRFIAADQ